MSFFFFKANSAKATGNTIIENNRTDSKWIIGLNTKCATWNYTALTRNGGCTPVTLAFRRQRQKDQGFQPSLGYMSPSLNSSNGSMCGIWAYTSPKKPYKWQTFIREKCSRLLLRKWELKLHPDPYSVLCSGDAITTCLTQLKGKKRFIWAQSFRGFGPW